MTEVLRWELDASQMEGSLRSASQAMDATRSAAGDLGTEMDKAMVTAADGAGEATEAVDDLGKQTEDSGTKGTEAGVAFGASFKAIAAGAAVAAAAIAGIALAAVDLSDEANQIAKQAAVVGETAEDFQILQGVFDLMTDGSVNAQMALVKLNKGLDDASAGIGPAAEALERLGLSAEDLIPLSAIERITVIGDEIGKMDNRAAQTITAMDLLGRAGFALVPAMAAGGDAIRAAADEFASAGVISNELAAESEVLQDELLLLEQSLSSLANEGLEPVIPLLADVAAGVREVINEVKEKGAIDDFTESMGRLGQSIFQVDAEISIWDELLSATISDVSRLVDTVTLMNEAVGLFPKAISSAITGSDSFRESLARFDDTLTALLGKLNLLSGETQAANKNLDRGVPSVVALTDAMKNLDKVAADTGESLGKLPDDAGKAGDAVAEFLESLPAGGTSEFSVEVLTNPHDVEDMTAALGDMAAEVEVVKDWFDELAGVSAVVAENVLGPMADIGGGFQTIFSNAVRETQSEIERVEGLMVNATDQAEKERLGLRLQALAKQEKAEKEAALVAFGVSQAVATSQAAVSTALAVVNALASPVPFPVAVGFSIAAGIAGAVQIAAIASQPPPKLHTGGLFDNEVPVIGQRGESMNNRLGTKVLGEDGLRAVNRGEGIGGSLTVINKVNNRTTNVASHEAIRTRSGELYDETVRVTQPKSGTRVPTWGRG